MLFSLDDAGGVCFTTTTDPADCVEKKGSFKCKPPRGTVPYVQVKLRPDRRNPGSYKLKYKAKDADIQCLDFAETPWTMGLEVGDDCGQSVCPSTGRRIECFSMPDLFIHSGDITFHDPLTGTEIFPGDTDTVLAGEAIEIRANITNIGGLPTPAGIEVEILDSVVTFTPPSVSSQSLLATLTLPALIPIGDPLNPAPGSSQVLSFETAFFTSGFHVIDGQIDPTNLVDEQNEDNNQSTQGFWIGEIEPGFEGDLVATECEVETPSGNFVGNVPAALPDQTVLVFGRADYLPLVPFDPDHSLGISAARGGVVSLSLTDSTGIPVTITSDTTQVMPTAGDLGLSRALHTSIDGNWPNRSEEYSFPAPAAEGSYILRACVSDSSFEDCCEGEFEVLQPPDLFIHSEDITFVSKNGYTTPFAQAEVGDTIVLGGQLHNSASGGTATDITGTVYIELGYGRIELGTFEVNTMVSGETRTIDIIPNPLLPVPAVNLGNGQFSWIVTQPSPWLHGFCYEITGSVLTDSSPFDNTACRSLTVGGP